MKSIFLILAVAGFTLGLGSVAAADHGGPHCDELPANITPDHPDWDDSLDSDSDGVACEDDSQPPWSAPTTSTTVPVTTITPAPVAPSAPPAQPVIDEPSFTG